MFGKKEEEPQQFSMQAINTIGNGTTVEGNIKTNGDIRIDGKLTGNVITSGRLVMGASSEVIGDLTCINANIDGFVRGNIIVKDILKITKTANIDGNITCAKLIVEEDALVQAKISMNVPTKAQKPTN